MLCILTELFSVTKDNYLSYQFGTPENVGKLIQEINIRLAGFGGNVPTTEFDKRTEDTIKQFQRDYMNITPTGKICGGLLNAIDEFCKDPKYPSRLSEMHCTCLKPKNKPPKGYVACSGFGNGLTKSIAGVNGIEYPGIHRSLVFIFKAMLFYVDKIDYPCKFDYLSSTYRCWADNMDASRYDSGKIRTTSNHMGTALDIHFTDGSNKTYDDIRRDIFCKYMGAPETGGGQKDGFGWISNHVGLEPKKFNNGKSGATTWVHVDIREFRKYKDNNFFIKKEKDLIPQSIISLAKSLTLNFICTCNLSDDKTLKGKEKNNNHLFNVDDAVEGLKVINQKYGKEMAMSIESIYRWEGDHFKSEQYKYTGTPGMHAFNKIGPSYGGWDTSLYDEYPEYTPIGIWYSKENGGNPGRSNDQQKGILMYIKFSSVEAGMMYIAAFITRHGGNVGRWHSGNSQKQKNYIEDIRTALPRISREF